MAITNQRMSVIDTVNEVRRLIGLDPVTSLLADSHARVALRLLNFVVSKISNAGDWHEMLASATVTAQSSVREYELGVKHPVKGIYEVAVSGQRQPLDPLGLDRYLQYSRVGGTGIPRFFAIKGVDSQSNPIFAVHPMPGSAQAGEFFGVTYFKKPAIYLTTDADTIIPFPANVVVAGLYAKVLEEEAGGMASKEVISAWQDFLDQMNEELNRYNADTGGSTVQLAPRYA
jgi:hypothetical protein